MLFPTRVQFSYAALVTRLHDVKISFFASEIKGIYLNKRIKKKKKKSEIFLSMSSTSSQKLKKKKK